MEVGLEQALCLFGGRAVGSKLHHCFEFLARQVKLVAHQVDYALAEVRRGVIGLALQAALHEAPGVGQIAQADHHLGHQIQGFAVVRGQDDGLPGQGQGEIPHPAEEIKHLVSQINLCPFHHQGNELLILL